jgi:Ca-activated chloride channel family protein
VGTQEGGHIPLPKEGFIQEGGDVVISKTDPEQLATLASLAGGQHAQITLDNSDIRALALRSVDSDEWQDSDRDLAIQSWQDDGYWLLWLALPLALLAWRRGALLIIPLVFAPLVPQPAQAMEWVDLWSRPDQRGEQLIEQDAASAASKFSDPSWRGSALYRAGDYEAAAEQFAGSSDAQAYYNRGNALARQGELKKAIAAYDRALEENPDHDDARHNRDLVKQLLEQQEQQKKNKQQQQRQQQQQNQQQNKDNQDGDQKQSGDRSQNQESDGQQGQGQQQEKQRQSGSQGQQNQSEGAGQSGGSQSEDQQQQANGGSSDGQNTQGEKPRDSSGQQQGQAGQEKPGESSGQTAQVPRETSPLSQSEEQWLRRIPDDPSGLMRRKFLYQYRERNTQQPKEGDTPW